MAGSNPLQTLPEPMERSALLERVLASSQLRRAERLRKILVYVGKRALNDNCCHISEQEIGSSVFGRPDFYDTATDNTVRVYASVLRKRIEAYFDSDGLHEKIMMEIPRGSYLPVFRYRSSIPKPTAERNGPALVPISISPEAVPQSRNKFYHPSRTQVGLFLSTLLIVILASTCVALWVQMHEISRSLYAWRNKPALLAFWSGFLDTGLDTDIVTADSSYALVQILSRKTLSFNSYLTHSYVSQLKSEQLSPEMRDAVELISSWNLANKSGFNMAQRILALDPNDRRLHLYYARDYMPDLIRRDNIILLGSPIANPWAALFANQLNFTEKVDIDNPISPVSINNRAPIAGEQSVYNPGTSTLYCGIAYLPKPDHDGNVLLVTGTGSEAVEAAGDFLLSEEQLANFMRTLHVTKLPYFEVLLKISRAKDTPIAETIEAYRTYPNLH